MLANTIIFFCGVLFSAAVKGSVVRIVGEEKVEPGEY